MNVPRPWKNLDWPIFAEDTTEGLLNRIREWEFSRLKQDSEYALVVTRAGEVFERFDFEFQTTFDGWDNRELAGAILSHTHRRGLPPSGPDVTLLLRLPKLTQFRVARLGQPTIVMRRPKLVNNAITSADLKRARMRTEDRRQPDWSDEKRAEVLWEELMPVLDQMGIEFWEEC